MEIYTFKQLVKMLSDATTAERAYEVLGIANLSYQHEKITFSDLEMFIKLTTNLVNGLKEVKQ